MLMILQALSTGRGRLMASRLGDKISRAKG